MTVYQVTTWGPHYHEDADAIEIKDALLWTPRPIFSTLDKAKAYVEKDAIEEVKWDGWCVELSDKTEYHIHLVEVE